MNLRRSAAALAAVAVIGTATPAVAAGPSPSASPSPVIPDGLYGRTDPTYDGVWRQSLTLLAQDTVGVKPAIAAVDWLTGQQCANGAFAAFRADTAEPCGAGLVVDTNSTAAAVQALAALGGHDAATGKAVTWLKSVQNADGGWGYTPGGASDANSTSVVIGALATAGGDPKDVRKGGRSPYDALLKLALPCDGDGAGAFAYQPDKKGRLTANADATAAAVLGALGKGLAGDDARPDAAPPACGRADGPGQAAHNGAAYLRTALAKDKHLTQELPGAKPQPDYGNTADAVVALATVGQGDRAADSLRWLETHYEQWAKQSGPAAYAQLILAANAEGSDPRHFGGQDLVRLMDATGPAPASVPDAKGSEPHGSEDAAKSDKDEGPLRVAWIVGACLLALTAGGILYTSRGGRRQP
ncbi:prenyltransferase/squalene oxidase repeat-containing protein [Streptomyces sp. NPDC059687]|uniref:prenyltransferase/squalene oxidase repeat-containing protein n=1 Tax=Streptomyces sp. NPDC059687 TaxID=3346905 RepID=UPI0036C4B7A1